MRGLLACPLGHLLVHSLTVEYFSVCVSGLQKSLSSTGELHTGFPVSLLAITLKFRVLEDKTRFSLY